MSATLLESGSMDSRVGDSGAPAALDHLEWALGRSPGAAPLRVLTSSVWAFNRRIAPGLPILAGRIADAIEGSGQGLAVGAHVLGAAMDEFGLSGDAPLDHHRLYREFAEAATGQTEFDDRDAVPEAITMGQEMGAAYRHEPVAVSLGYHAASELTSDMEFTSWERALRASGRVDLAESAYIQEHVAVEEDHGASSQLAIDRWLQVQPADEAAVVWGAERYLVRYAAMMHQIADAMIEAGAGAL